MRTHGIPAKPERRDRLIRERVHDPYKVRRKLPEPALCPECGAIYQAGRWRWSKPKLRPEGAHEVICQACHRIRDQYPAGELTLSGHFLEGQPDRDIESGAPCRNAREGGTPAASHHGDQGAG